MKSKLSIAELRNDVGKYHSFLLTSSDATCPLRISAQFNQVAVSISPYPYVVFKGKFGEATIRHIQTIHKKIEGSICTYIFACLDYSTEDAPLQVHFQVDCF